MMILKTLALALAALAATALAGPIGDKRLVTVKMHPPNASTVTVTGVREQGVDMFLGVPFGESPTGALRFAHPVAKKYCEDVNATVFAPVCMQENQSLYNETGFTEDCLTLNIVRPAAKRGKCKKELPVMVWIYGGGFYEGSANFYTSPTFVQHSVDIGRPVLVVYVNYRLGAFGFMYGRDAAANDAENLGLRDQLLALQWVQDNIGAYGGDPSKVTVFGQSAGAISISIHLLNQQQDLFRAAILHSGAPSVLTTGPVATTWQSRADQFASFARCQAPNATALGNQSTFECLRNVPASTLVAANQATRYAPGNAEAYYMTPAVDGDILPEQPIEAVRKGAFARMPLMMGNTRDEGFYTSPMPVNASKTVYEFINEALPEPAAPTLIDEIAKAYPDVPEIGSPFGTGNETFDHPTRYKQFGAILGDGVMQSRRRVFLRKANELNVPTWTFEWWGRANYNPPDMGIAHSSDMPYLFGRASVANNWTQAEEDAGKRLVRYWVNFAYDLDPNGKHTGKKGKDHKAPYWPAHKYPANKNQMRMEVDRFHVVQDDYREDQMKVFDLPGMAEALHYRRSVA